MLVNQRVLFAALFGWALSAQLHNAHMFCNCVFPAGNSALELENKLFMIKNKRFLFKNVRKYLGKRLKCYFSRNLIQNIIYLQELLLKNSELTGSVV